MVAVGVAAALVMVIGVLTAVRLGPPAPPLTPATVAQRVLAGLAVAAAEHPEAHLSPPARRQLHLVLYRRPGETVCQGSAAAVAMVAGAKAPRAKSLGWRLAVEHWAPAADALRGEGCDPATTKLMTLRTGPVYLELPLDERSLIALPDGFELPELLDRRLLGRTPIADIDAMPEAIRAVLDREPERWWSRWVEFVTADVTTAGQRRAAMQAASERTDAQLVGDGDVDLAGRRGVTVRVPFPAGAVADLVFDERSGVLLQCGVIQPGGEEYRYGITAFTTGSVGAAGTVSAWES